ncbi:MAG: GH3 auxin-responsive promoter family protein [Isosphaeraceae bacterium]|nr:GH3 auxin-responsive promoter family protein [Isosphaeraceae bacterium]
MNTTESNASVATGNAFMDFNAIVGRLAGAGPVRLAVDSGFHIYARRRMRHVSGLDPAAVQRRTLLRLTATAAATRFGKDHGFGSVRGVEDFQRQVPLRTYEDLWNAYLKERYPVYDNLTWPGRIPYLALTSGTTTGANKYIPVSAAMVRSNRKAAQTMIAAYLDSRPGARLFRGKLFFLGGSSDLTSPAPGVSQGDLSGIASRTVGPWLRAYTFPPLDLALDPDWDRKLRRLVELSLREPITLVSGVSSCLVTLFQRVLEASGKATVAEVWPTLELVVHGGVKFEPYRASFATLLGSPRVHLQESYPCSEGFVAFGDPQTGLLRLLVDHGIFFEFVPLEELGTDRPVRHWLGNVEIGVNYAIVVSTCAGMWAHIIGDTVRFESLNPPLLTFTGRTKYYLSAFGEHLISEEVEGAIASAATAVGASVRDWHVGPVFREPLGYHRFVVEFVQPPTDLSAFRRALDAELIARNAHYEWFRAEGGGLPAPEICVVKPGGFDAWMRSRGKLGGQHKVPRMDSSGTLTAELTDYVKNEGLLERALADGADS